MCEKRWRKSAQSCEEFERNRQKRKPALLGRKSGIAHLSCVETLTGCSTDWMHHWLDEWALLYRLYSVYKLKSINEGISALAEARSRVIIIASRPDTQATGGGSNFQHSIKRIVCQLFRFIAHLTRQSPVSLRYTWRLTDYWILYGSSCAPIANKSRERRDFWRERSLPVQMATFPHLKV